MELTDSQRFWKAHLDAAESFDGTKADYARLHGLDKQKPPRPLPLPRSESARYDSYRQLMIPIGEEAAIVAVPGAWREAGVGSVGEAAVPLRLAD